MVRMSSKKLDVRKIRYFAVLLLGVILGVAGLFFVQNRWGGVLVGLGAGLFGMAGAQLITEYVMQRNPGLQRRATIEQSDERNIQINNYAKAKAFEFGTFLALPYFLILVIADVQLWIILLSVALYVAHYAVYLWILSRRMRDV
jgi:hypothetical protein